MNTPHWWNWLLEACYFAGYSAVAITIARKQLLRVWPLLFLFCTATALMTVLTVALQGHRSTYTAYFYMHWIGEAVRAVLMLGVLYETAHTVPLVRQIPGSARTFFATLICATTLAAVFYTAEQAPATPYAFTNAAMMLERCASIAWCVFALGLFATIALVGLAWTDLPLRIARGAVWQTLVAIACTHAISMHPPSRIAVTIFGDCLHLCSVPYWCWALRQPDSETTEDLAALQSLLPSLRYYFTDTRKGDLP